MNQLQRIQRSLAKKSIPQFEIGDTVRVHVKVVEGEKERVQIYEGIVIARKGGRNSETFTVRKISYGVGVERIFPVHSPTIARIEVVRHGKVRRAKLYYLRTKKGKMAKVSEREFSGVRQQAAERRAKAEKADKADKADKAEAVPAEPIPAAT